MGFRRAALSEILDSGRIDFAIMKSFELVLQTLLGHRHRELK